MINTFTATAAAALGWLFIEWIIKGKPSLLGMLSGIVAGFACLWGVNGLKKMLGADDSLDVFGVHGVGGIIGSIGTGIFVAPALGGVGVADYAMGAQVWKQFVAVVITMLAVWAMGR